MTSGDKSDLNPVFLNALASAGYAVVSVNYRLAPQFKFPAQIEDVKCAIRYLRAKAARYGLNATEIFAFGTSVGGQLVALAALTGAHSAFDVGPYQTQPSNLTALVDTFGPANLTQSASGFTASGIRQAAGDQTQLVLVQNMGHMFVQVGPKSLDPSLLQIAQDMTSFFNEERKM
jgi:acetyl esterase/lipase